MKENLENGKEYTIDGEVVPPRVVAMLDKKGVVSSVKSHEDPSGSYHWELIDANKLRAHHNESVAAMQKEIDQALLARSLEFDRLAELSDIQKETIDAQRAAIEAMKIQIDFNATLVKNIAAHPEMSMGSMLATMMDTGDDTGAAS